MNILSKHLQKIINYLKTLKCVFFCFNKINVYKENPIIEENI